MTIDTIRKFCITLPERPQRKAAAIDHFHQNGLYGVQFVDGIYGEGFGLVTKFPYEVDAPGSGFNMGTHCVGIWLSHWMLWFAMSLLPDPCALILEDDAKLLPGWKDKVNQALADVPPDFDWLYIGSCCAEDKKISKVKGDIWRLNSAQCFHAYVINKKCIQHVLATQRKCYAPIDISVTFHSFEGLNIYAVLPRLIEQHNTEIPK